MKTLWAVFILVMASSYSIGQSFTEKISKELTFEKKGPENAIMIANINGDIKVEGYSGDKIIVEVTKSIRAKTAERLEKGKTQVQLGVIDLSDTIVLYVQGTDAQFGRKRDRGTKNGWYKGEYGYNWCCNGDCDNDCHCKLDYDYKMDFVVKVPASIHVQVSTVNDGDIEVKRVSGAVKADNINGSIKMADLMREAIASTINGNVDVEYASNPRQDCRFYTLNGDINAWFQKGLAANLSFESFNGSFYTNISQLESMPVSVEKNATEKGMKYKVSDNRYKVGKGGVFLDFETFNGNVYLKEKTN